MFRKEDYQRNATASCRYLLRKIRQLRALNVANRLKSDIALHKRTAIYNTLTGLPFPDGYGVRSISRYFLPFALDNDVQVMEFPSRHDKNPLVLQQWFAQASNPSRQILYKILHI